MHIVEEWFVYSKVNEIKNTSSHILTMQPCMWCLVNLCPNYPQGKPSIRIVWKWIHLTDNVNTLTIFLPVWLFVHKSLCSYLSKVICDQICQNLPHSYAHNIKEWISSPINSSINKLTIITTKSWLVCFYWGLFLRPVRHSWILKYQLSTTGWLVQAATLLVNHHVTHGWYKLWI